MIKIGFIGAGKVGVSLGKYFSEVEDLSIVGYYSRSVESSSYAAKVTNSAQYNNLEKLIEKSNILIITTPDDAIKDIWSQVSSINIQNKVICHCSGSLSSETFFDISEKNAYACSFHPLMAINSKEYSYKELGDAFFTVEGDKYAVEIIENIFKKTNNDYKVINTSEKTRYHISSVFISNFMLALGNVSLKLLKEYGFDEKSGLEALNSLAMGNIKKFFEKGPSEALTGPIERNDLGTVKRHLDALSSEEYDRIEKIYRLMSLELVDIASNKNHEKDYENLKNLLEKGDSTQK
ncbi:Rossmann-like and DUF2520 domain-containing protein [Peptostreptococcus faecalis]|uniref:Rossmann-like and DUF2520 domain-containing protein n=1 Tax=Peptostreptococcus faecalis TaxID=2045015 RepID=UPI000C798A03|nr:Rossmann-like and DUF2520 domain-containing protein [Peptostreptococcus faecalis]